MAMDAFQSFSRFIAAAVVALQRIFFHNRKSLWIAFRYLVAEVAAHVAVVATEGTVSIFAEAIVADQHGVQYLS